MTTTRRLAAILAADMVGYSRLMNEDEEGTLARLVEVRQAILDPAVGRSGGRIVKTTGDGFLVEFPSAVEALRCALEIQEQVRDREKEHEPECRFQFRIGINVGDVIATGDDIHGDGVNIAARLEASAEPGGILVAANAHAMAVGKVKCAFEDAGEQRLKNIAEPLRAYRVMRASEPERPSLPLPDKPSIAVLPFANMSGDPEQEYFADRMVEEIITALSRVRWLFVIARNSSFAYKGKLPDLRQVGRELGVRYVLEGSVRKGGNRVRVTTQLIDASSGAHVWAERYDRDLSDIFTVQDEITASVAGVIEPALAEAEQQRVLRKPPERLDAWEAYQRGLWHFYKYGPEDNKNAQAFFSRAIELDRNFAPGHYGYAFALQWDIWHYSGRPYSEVQGVPRDEALLAVALDDKDAMAHAVLAHIRMWGGEWEAAIAEARAAHALNPNSAFVISMLGCVLGHGGYPEEALERLRQAMRASPHDPLTWLWTRWIAGARFYARDFAAALETFTQLVRLRPRAGVATIMTAAALGHLGRLEEARVMLDRAEREFPDDLRRYRQHPPWLRPEDYAISIEGLRLAGLSE
jgi:adenylate cyclase